jgi:glutathione S-transferase
MTGPVTLWGAGTSRTLRPLWVAEELGIAYELKPIGPRTGETQTAEYTRLNPKQKIPLLVDGDLRLSESVAICRYLIEAYPGPAIRRPTTLEGRAREDEWCCYVYGELDESSLYVMRRHGDLGHIYGASPPVVASAAEYAARHLRVLDAELSGREHAMDEGFGLADVLLVSCLDWAIAYEVELPRGLAAYRDRIAQREAYGRAMAVNFRGSRPRRSS